MVLRKESRVKKIIRIHPMAYFVSGGNWGKRVAVDNFMSLYDSSMSDSHGVKDPLSAKQSYSQRK